ncbi:MAG: hypothetical protein ACUVRK_13520 [Spirochaetota bacterium]
MEKPTFWTFIVIIIIAGVTLGLAIYGIPPKITGKATISPVVPGISCNDSDGDINLALKGYCLDPWGKHTDLCVSETDLVEYWCTNVSCVSKSYNCLDYGYTRCYDGACIGNSTMGTSETERVMPSENCTYKGVLDMLNKCVISVTTDGNKNCNIVCAYQNLGTCTMAYAINFPAKMTFPYECNRYLGNNTNGTSALFCNCCKPLTVNATIQEAVKNCHYVYNESMGEYQCVSGAGLYSCSCGGESVVW